MKNFIKNLSIIFFILLSNLLFSQQYDIVWENLVGSDADENTLTKTGAAGWNAGATSANVLNAGVDGWVESTVIETNTSRMYGLNDTNVNASFQDINYAIYTRNDQALFVFENGSNSGQFGTYTDGDVLRINRSGTTVTYLKNNVVFYTSAISSTGSLFVDCSINSVGGTVASVVSSFCDPNNCSSVTSFWVDDGGSDIRYSDGVVVIGADAITKPAGYRLYVEGGILSEGINIALESTADWADYVFDDDYELMSLKERAKYIAENRHLPGVPSDKDIVRDGLDVAKMQAILLSQIEQIWLTLIELEKKN